MHPFASISSNNEKFFEELKRSICKFSDMDKKEGIRRSTVSDNPT
jgi:hypothetical protein